MAECNIPNQERANFSCSYERRREEAAAEEEAAAKAAEEKAAPAAQKAKQYCKKKDTLPIWNNQTWARMLPYLEGQEPSSDDKDRFGYIANDYGCTRVDIKR